MRGILLRLFVKIPLYILWFVMLLTVIIPIFYWVITDDGWGDVKEEIDMME